MLIYVFAVNTIRGAIRKLALPLGWTPGEAESWANALIASSAPAGATVAEWVVAAWRRVGAHDLAARVARANGLPAA